MELTTKDWLNIISDISSFIMAVLAIWLTLQLYFKSKESENNTITTLADIKTQTSFLKTITNNLIDYITKHKDNFFFDLVKYFVSQKKEPISELVNNKNVNIDVKISLIQYAIEEFSNSDSIIKWLYYKLKNQLEYKINFKNNVVDIINEKDNYSGSIRLNEFYKIFFRMHSSDIVKITSIDPFDFEINEEFVESIKIVYKENQPAQ